MRRRKFGARKAPRKRVAMSALVSDRSHSTWLSCTIRDASASGCRITGGDFTLLPEKIYLKAEHMSAPIKARIAWRRHRQAGVEFLWKSAPREGRRQTPSATSEPASTTIVLDDF